jgi:hypothetical protein
LGLQDGDIGAVVLVDQGLQKPIPVQWEIVGDKAEVKNLTLYWLLDYLDTGQKRNYLLEISPGEKRGKESPIPKEGVSLQLIEKERVEVKIDGQLFTSYHFGKNYVRPFLYPVIGPFGESVTRSYPMAIIPGEENDHPHQRSLWTAWGDVNGVDDWSEEKGHGNIVHQEFLKLVDGSVLGQLLEKNYWTSSEGQKLMEEIRELKFYHSPQWGRAIDLQVQFLASEGKVTFGDTKEGGIASVRVATSMNTDHGGRFENSYGATNEKEAWGKRAHWCDYSGIVAGRVCGITIFDSPSNLRHPTYWHVRNYGLMTANPFGTSYFTGDSSRRGDFTLPKGERLTFSYRIYIHSGDTAEGKVRSKYLDYVNPPEVQWR